MRASFHGLWRLVSLLAVLGPWTAGAAGADAAQGLLRSHCVDCHDTETKKGGLDLTALGAGPGDPSTLPVWIRVHDRVVKGEMPPAGKPQPTGAMRAGFLRSVSNAVVTADRAWVAREGRATRRRLNRYEYEETLRDVLEVPYLEVKAFLPEDREAEGYNKIGDALDVSHVQMARYLAASEFALRQAIAPQVTRPESQTRRFYTWEEPAFFGRIDLEGPLNRRTFPLVSLDLQLAVMAEKNRKMPHTTDPVRREQEALAVVVSTYEPSEIRFGSFRAPVSGRYKLRFSGYSIRMAADFKAVSKSARSEPVSIYAETPPRSLRKLGGFDFGADPTVCELDAWLLTGETIRPDAARLFRSRPPNHKNPLAGPDGMPGVAFQWMEVEGPVLESWPPASHSVLFGDLPITQRASARASDGARRRSASATDVEVVPRDPERDAARLMGAFVERITRHPVEAGEADRFLGVVRTALGRGYGFGDAMIAGYTAALCSPDFLYLAAEPGPLKDHALAERLSYFLWNSAPDATLRRLADRGQLRRSRVLREQTDRLLNDPRSRRFVDAFLDYWLDLRFISGTSPDEELYPDYQLDDFLAESMTEETQRFFAELVAGDLPANRVVSSDFVMVNERLATHYGIPGVEGVGVRKVTLASDSVRGGLLTQASVLKVTANGTTTSPVKRGAWVMSRIVGRPPPPPPPSVPAVDPDIRGATTIREQLAMHRTQESCNACHRLIDPAGFALESFDVMGGWRERYRSVGTAGDPVKGVGHNGNDFHFRLGPAVDPTGELPDGRAFSDVRQLKACLVSDEEGLARNLISQLALYSTGARPRFSDRPVLERILARSRASHYGVRTLIHELVQSDLFRNQ